MERAGLASALRRGIVVLIALGVFTAIEYVIPLALDSGSMPFLVVIGLAKAALIVYYFMHVAQLWREEE
ncbi:MAG: cytochrome C oxidase subunit IV family protein [Chloroflexi bacterium]|nr:cytochrome C oxidase subunit IV family protein [Chloroflexota bacterium]